MMGPMFETPAEIRTFRLWGADLIGMSTTSEVIVARHCGIKVLGIASVSNLASGISDEGVDHSKVVENAQVAAKDLSQLIKALVGPLHDAS